MRLFILGTLALAACGEADDDGEIAKTASSDVETMARTIEGASTTANEPAEPVCTETWGSCSACVTVDGSPTSGVFDLAAEALPCSGTGTGSRGGSATYTLTELDLGGTYEGTLAGDYTVTASGSRSATIEAEGPRGNMVTYDGDLDVTSLEGTTVGFALDTFALDATYTGWADNTWTLSVSGSASEVTGTLAGDDGRSCTVSGSAGAVEVTCAE